MTDLKHAQHLWWLSLLATLLAACPYVCHSGLGHDLGSHHRNEPAQQTNEDDCLCQGALVAQSQLALTRADAGLDTPCPLLGLLINAQSVERICTGTVLLDHGAHLALSGPTRCALLATYRC